ncbi:MAG: class B sortase [Clostridia bacterium]|nr:class B sortase [Clostridia bacterium]
MPQKQKWLKPTIAAGAGLVLALLVLLCVHRLSLRPEEAPPVSSTVSAPPVESEPPVVLPDNPIDFATLQAENPDVVGWIRVPGTVIDYPVMRSGEGTKEDFYLHHDTDRSYLFAGSIYMQKVNSPDFSDAATLLYGHNMKNGSKFAALHKFKQKTFFDENRTLYIYTPGHIYTYDIYSLFVHNNLLITAVYDFSNPADIAAYQQLTLEPKSYTKQVREGVVLGPDDRLVTLSTCTNKDDERLLLHAVLREDTPTK